MTASALPVITTRSEFAIELTALRERSGLTIRDVAKATKLQVSTLGGYFSGRHLPPLKPSNVLGDILRACGVTEQDLLDHWQEALLRVRRQPGPRPATAPVPYRGLASFQPEDAEWFFGREALTKTLIDLIASARHDSPGVLLVVGPSGAGKSSLLRAGLIAAIDEGGRALITPGPHPMEALAKARATIESASGGGQIIVVDQFEEVFTACKDEAEQHAFLAAILGAQRSSEQPDDTLFVLGLRADFYSRVLAHPDLARVAQARQLVVGPMSEAELRRAIELPARKAKADIESGLVELFLRDLAGSAGAVHDAGALPLLSHALLATWEGGHGRNLSVANYTEAGGIQGAVAQTAERTYQDLTSQQKQLARQLFTQLVIIGEEAADTRRRTRITDLLQDDDTAEILELFVDNRLITAENDTVQISHEALIMAWPRLQGWIDDDRAALLAAQQIADAATQWERENRDPAALYRGTRLALAKEWARGPGSLPPSGLSREFLQASRRRERRKTRRLYQTIAGLSAMLLVAVGAGITAVEQRAEATRERNAAISRLIATRADRVRDKDVALAAQLSLAAYRLTPTAEARSSLLDASASPTATRLLGGPGVMQSVALSADKKTLAAGGLDKLVRLWDVADPRRPVLLAPPLPGATDTIFSVALSPDGRTLAAAGGDKVIRLWDISDPRNPLALGQPLAGPTLLIYSLAFSPDGQTLAAGSGDTNVYLWDVAQPGSPRRLGAPLTGAGSYIQAVTFSPDGRLLAAGSDDKTVRLWDLTDRTQPILAGGPLSGPTRRIYSVAFSPDGNTLAAGSADSNTYLWNITDPSRPSIRDSPIPAGSGWVNGLAFNADGTTLAFAGSSSAVRIWDLTTKRITATLPHPGPVTAVVYGTNNTLITAAADGIARIWHSPWPVLAGQGDIVNGVAYDRSGTVLAVGSGETQLWNPATRTILSRTITNTALFSATVAFSPDQRTLAVGSRDGTIQLWDIADPTKPTPVAPPIAAHTLVVESLAFSPDGRTLASGADDNLVKIWDIASPSTSGALAQLDGFTSYVYSVAFSPNGTILAAASTDKTVRLWDVTNRSQPTQLGKPMTVSDHYALAVAFSPDGLTLAVGSADKTIRLFDVTNPTQPRQIGAPMGGPTNYVYALAFAADGGTLAAGSTDETVWLWDVHDPAHPVVIATLTVPIGAIYTVAFHPNGHSLAAGGAEKTVWLWETDPQRVIDHICAYAGDALTVDEWNRYVPDIPYQDPCG